MYTFSFRSIINYQLKFLIKKMRFYDLNTKKNDPPTFVLVTAL